MRSLIPVGFLVVALPLLAGLQYQWIGQISQAERQKLEAGLRDSSARFAQDFGDEFRRLSEAIQIRGALQSGNAVNELVDRYRYWARTAVHPNLVEALYLADAGASDTLQLRKLDVEGAEAEAVAWPEDLSDLAAILNRSGGAPMRIPGDLHGVILLIEPVAGPPRPSNYFGSERGPGPDPRNSNGWLIARLDRAVIANEILPALADRYFPQGEDQGYRVTVVEASEAAPSVYTSGGIWSALDLETADSAVDLVGSGRQGPPPRGPGPDREFDRGPQRGSGRPGGPESGFDRGGPGRGPGPRGLRGPNRGRGPPPGQQGQTNQPGGGPGPLSFHWRLLVKHHAGSLDIAVENARRRNLAVSSGILLVLTGAAFMVVVSGRRARALARTQMEFAAGVSHELRTPLAVIQSAAHNLESGIVRDPESIEQYAGIVQTEARRLSTMVEQVLAYSETQSGRKRYDVSLVDVRDAVDQSLRNLSLSREVHAGVQVTVEQRIDPELPPALADPLALTQCLQNLISNAVKYGERDGAVHIEIEAGIDTPSGKIRLAVLDRGQGVPPGDVGSLFKPFHRGSNAMTNTPGNGLGLHLVRTMMEAQHGAVRYAPRPGGGSGFTLIVPAAGLPG